jgi:hypothetical protein
VAGWWGRQSDSVKAAWIGLLATAVLAPVVAFLLTRAGGSGSQQDGGSHSASPGPVPSPRSGAVAAGLLGTWKGAVVQQATYKYAVTVKVEQGEVGDTVGTLTIDVPGGGTCLFALRLLDAGNETVQVEGRLVRGANCVPGLATLERLGADEVEYRLVTPPSQGVLQRSSG